MSGETIEKERRWLAPKIKRDRPLLVGTPAEHWLKRRRAKIKTAPASRAREGHLFDDRSV